MEPLFAQPFESWTLNTETGLWVPPIEIPLDNKEYEWDEDSQSWIYTGRYLNEDGVLVQG